MPQITSHEIVHVFADQNVLTRSILDAIILLLCMHGIWQISFPSQTSQEPCRTNISAPCSSSLVPTLAHTPLPLFFPPRSTNRDNVPPPTGILATTHTDFRHTPCYESYFLYLITNREKCHENLANKTLRQVTAAPSLTPLSR